MCVLGFPVTSSTDSKLGWISHPLFPKWILPSCSREILKRKKNRMRSSSCVRTIRIIYIFRKLTPYFYIWMTGGHFWSLPNILLQSRTLKRKYPPTPWLIHCWNFFFSELLFPQSPTAHLLEGNDTNFKASTRNVVGPIMDCP